MTKQTKKKSETGFLHDMPLELASTLDDSSKMMEAWNSLTPLARNEWICWITSAKKEETRKQRLVRAKTDLMNGKRRPCCWPGCPHRSEKAKKWFERKKEADLFAKR